MEFDVSNLRRCIERCQFGDQCARLRRVFSRFLGARIKPRWFDAIRSENHWPLFLKMGTIGWKWVGQFFAVFLWTVEPSSAFSGAGEVQFARLHHCDNSSRCLIHGSFGAGRRAFLLGRNGSHFCAGITVGEEEVGNEVSGPFKVTAVQLPNCSGTNSYFLAVLTERIGAYKVVEIDRVRRVKEERLIESLARRDGLLGRGQENQGPQSFDSGKLLRLWRPPADPEITATAERGLSLYSVGFNGSDARLAVFKAASPNETNGPTIFVRDRRLHVVTGIMYHNSSGEANKSMIGFSLNGQEFLLVSGSWCEGCGHHGIELFRLDQHAPILVYRNADGST